jgi:hypothetical protein
MIALKTREHAEFIVTSLNTDLSPKARKHLVETLTAALSTEREDALSTFTYLIVAGGHCSGLVEFCRQLVAMADAATQRAQQAAVKEEAQP